MSREFGFMAIADAQTEELRRDPNTYIIGLNTTKGGGMQESKGIYQAVGGDQLFDAPIDEMGYAEFAVGMAMTGIRTICEIQFGDFTSYAFDAIVNQAAKVRYLTNGQANCPIVFRSSQGRGMMFGAQHSQNVEAWYMNVPGLKICVPTYAADYKGLLKTAINDGGPVLYLESKATMFMKGEVPDDEDFRIPFGQANVVREGTDVTIVATQKMILESVVAGKQLEKEGISVEIIDPRTLVPLDKETILGSARKTGRVLIAHDAPVRGGWGAEVASVITENCFGDLKAPVKRLGSLNTPIPFGRNENYIYPNADKVKEAVLELMKA